MRRAETLFLCVACIAVVLGSSVSQSPGPDMSYRSVLSHLYKVNAWHPVKLGLDNMHQLNKILGYPLKGIPIVHVAGTNGKGSVSLKIAKGLSAVGLKAGMFTSPHISSFRERIQVNDVPLSEQDVQVYFWMLASYVEATPTDLSCQSAPFICRPFSRSCSIPASNTTCPRRSSNSPPPWRCCSSSGPGVMWLF